MKTTAFITWALLASCLAFGAGSAASWLLGRPASASGDGSGVSDPLLPDLVAVTLEAAPEGESEATRVIFVGKHEVTIAGWEQCVDAGACDHRPRQRKYQGADHPVTGVNWLDVQQYVRWLSEHTGERLRLPRASEWDFLAQDVVEQEVKKLWDDPRLAWAADYANYGLRGSKATKPVGHFSENRQGNLRPRRERLGVDRYLLAEQRREIVQRSHRELRRLENPGRDAQDLPVRVRASGAGRRMLNRRSSCEHRVPSGS